MRVLDRRAKQRMMATAAVFTLSLSGVLFGQANAPTTQSTVLPPAASEPAASTAPSVAVDPSTPRGALKSLITAMEAGDGDKIKSLIATTSPSEDRMVIAMANMSTAEKKFRDAATATYGPNAKELTGDAADQTAKTMSKIDSAKETIDGDKAVVDSGGNDGPQGGTPPLALIKSGSTWKIPIAELSRGVDQSTIDKRLDDLAFMATVMNDTATEMSKGTYKTTADAKEAIKSKMMMAMMKRQASASQPATAPAAAPAPVPAGGM